MKHIKIKILFCLSILLIGCKKEEFSNETHLLIGKWEFAGESNSYGYQIESTSTNHTLEFKQKGKYKVNFETFGKNTEHGRIEKVSKYLNHYELVLNHDLGANYYDGIFSANIYENWLQIISSNNNTNNVKTYTRIE